MSALKDRIEQVKAAITEDRNRKQVQYAASNKVLTLFLKRIFKDGKATDGSDIGQYSTNPFTVQIDELSPQLPLSRVKARSRNGKTAYYQGGNKELRADLGRQNKKVDLNLTGSSERTIQVGPSGDDIVMGFTDKESMDILKKNEKKFKGDGAVFTPSKSERELAAVAASKEMAFIIESI